MNYYLSYVERKGHAALCLSLQSTPDSLVEVVYDFGFVPAGDYEYWNTVPGVVVEEDNASRALYSASSRVKHRTYQISESEFNQCLVKLNGDRRKNLEKKVDVAAQWQKVGGADYQDLLFNCKSYALSVFKELGIMDVNKVRNFLIQRPHTTEALLKDLTSKELTCPLKDNFSMNFNSTLEELKEKLLSIQSMRGKMNLQDANHPNINREEMIFKKISDMIEYVGYAFEYSKKIGISDEDKDRRVRNLETLIRYNLQETLNNIDVTFKTDSGLSKESFDRDILEVNRLLRSLKLQSDEMGTEMEKLVKEGRIDHKGSIIFPIFWKEIPAVSPRADLSHFSDTEKAMLLIRTKGDEMSDGLKEISKLLAQKITELEDSSDLVAIKSSIDASIKELNDTNRAFMSNVTNLSKNKGHQEQSILKAYIAHNDCQNRILEKLGKNISNIELQSPEKTGGFMKFMQKMINFFKKDYEILGTDPKSVLVRKLDQLKTKTVKEPRSVALVRDLKSSVDDEPVVSAIHSEPEANPAIKNRSKSNGTL